MHLQEVVAGAGHRQFEEVEADAAAPTGGDGKGEEQTCIPPASASGPVFGPLAAALLDHPTRPMPAPGPHRSFLLRSGLLYRRSPRGDRMCIPAAGSLRDTVLQELHATPLGGHLGSVLGRNKTLALARRSVWWPGLSAAVEKCIHTCPTCQRVKEDNLQPAGLLFPLPVPSRRDGSMIACIHRLSRTSCGSGSLWPRLLQVAGAY